MLLYIFLTFCLHIFFLMGQKYPSRSLWGTNPGRPFLVSPSNNNFIYKERVTFDGLFIQLFNNYCFKSTLNNVLFIIINQFQILLCFRYFSFAALSCLSYIQFSFSSSKSNLTLELYLFFALEILKVSRGS